MPTRTAAAVVSSPSPGTSSTTRRPKALRYKAPSFLQPTRRPTARAIAASAAGRRDRDRVVCKAKDASSAAGHVGDVGEQMRDEAVLGCETAVLVEFWAPWCGPCRLMHPVIADLAKAFAGRLRCLRVNTDENQEVATRYGIRSIPTILLFSKGERKETIIGAGADTALAATVDRFL